MDIIADEEESSEEEEETSSEEEGPVIARKAKFDDEEDESDVRLLSTGVLDHHDSYALRFLILGMPLKTLKSSVRRRRRL